MVCYQDEKVTIEPFEGSDEELRALIEELEIKNFGHVIDYDSLPDPPKRPIFDIWHNNDKTD